MRIKVFQIFISLGLAAVTTACSDIRLENPPATIRDVSVKVHQYCPQSGRDLVNIFAVNLSAQTAEDQILLDSDRDGLPDIFEQTVSNRDEYNISYTSKDTNGDGYSDFATYHAGIKADVQNGMSVCDDPDLDTDRDGLSDCEESLLGTDYRKPDTDYDGIPDALELRFGLNPLTPDSELDPDGDGINNLDEVKSNSLVYVNHSTQILKHSLLYKVDTFIHQDAQQECYEIQVSNIPLVNVSNGNMIRIMFLERETVIGQGQVNYLRDVTVIASRAFAAGHVIEVDDVQNQTIIAVP